MKTYARALSCKYCGSRFSSHDDRCPDCGHRSPKGRVKAGLVVLSVTTAIVAVVLTLFVAEGKF